MNSNHRSWNCAVLLSVDSKAIIILPRLLLSTTRTKIGEFVLIGGFDLASASSTS